MRSLKPFALALSGLIAALFGAVFFGPQTPTPAPASTEGLHHDAASKRVPLSTDVVVARDAKSDAPKSRPAPPPHFPLQDFSLTEAPRIVRELSSRPLVAACERLNDRRLALLVGVVELRI